MHLHLAFSQPMQFKCLTKKIGTKLKCSTYIVQVHNNYIFDKSITTFVPIEQDVEFF